MVAQTPEAHSAKTIAELKTECLRRILAYEIQPFFIRPHLNREFIVGLIGMRGDGKSGSGATISLVDFGLRGVQLWSNMPINANLQVDDGTARSYGLKKGGLVSVKSQEIDKWKLLDLDMQYADSFIWIDEINVGYSNVRKTQANTNIDFNIVVQELRKFHSSLGYSVIDEMFIDPQLRTLTDVFIKCEDTALSVDGLTVQKPTGIDFKWTIYPMTGYLVGRENSYYVTKKAMPPVYFHFKPWRGIYDSGQFQRKGTYTMSTKDREKLNAEITVEESQGNREEFDEWGWLEEKALQLKRSNIDFLVAGDLWNFLEIWKHGRKPIAVGPRLSQYGISRHHQNKTGQWVYKINDFSIDSLVADDSQPTALAAASIN